MPKPTIPTAVVITALTAFLGGGLAGAIFNYYVNRPKPTVLIYTVSTTTIAAAESASFIPNLRVALGQEAIKSLYVHTIEVTAASGPFLQQLDLAITFPSAPHVYGTNAQPPSPLHKITCSGTVELTCQLSPISTEFGAYKVSIATDTSVAPKPVIAADRVKLLSAQDVATTNRGWLWFLRDPEKISLVVGTLAYVWATSFLVRKIASRSVIVGRILSAQGTPVPGAEVEVMVKSPGKMERIATTDASGDFLIGLRKQAFFSARVRISHPSFATTEFETNSAIMICQLPAGTSTPMLHTSTIKD